MKKAWTVRTALALGLLGLCVIAQAQVQDQIRQIDQQMNRPRENILRDDAAKTKKELRASDKKSSTANSVSAAAVATPAGENLANESCDLRTRDDVAPLDGLPTDQQFFCSDKLAGQIAYDRFSANLKGDAALAQAALLAQYRRSRVEKLIAAKANCAEPKWPDATAYVAILPCQLKSGGWPHMVVLSAAKGILRVADGSPVMLPVMLKQAELSAKVIEAVSNKAYLQTLWNKPIVLASSSDLARFKQLVKDGRSASSSFNFSQAEDILRQALDLQSKFLSENDPAIADTLIDIALNASNQGKSEEAQALFRRAAGIIEKSPFESDRARLASYQGYEAANRGDYDAALKNARLASAAWRKLAGGASDQGVLRGDASDNHVERAELAMALNFEALMSLRNEDVVSASALASESLLRLTQAEGSPVAWKADVLTTLGELAIIQGRLSAAETYFNSALEIRKRVFGEGPMTFPVLAALGKAYQREGMNSSAIITYRSLFQMVRKLPTSAGSFSNEQLVPFGAAVADFAVNLTEESAKQGLYAEAFDAFQLARSGLIDKTIAKAQARLGNDDPQIAALVDELQTRQRQIEGDRAELAKEQALPNQERSAIAEARLQKAIIENRRLVSELNGKLATQFPNYSKLANPRPIELIEMRKRLGDREALVSFLIGKKQSFIQITRRGGNTIAKINEGEDGLRDAVKSLRFALEVQGGAIKDFDLALAHRLYQTLFGGVEKELSGVDHLIVAGMGPLASLPFGILVTQAPANLNYSKAAWLGQKFAISHVPSLQAFYTLRGATAKLAPTKVMLAFANPVFDDAAKSAAGSALIAGPCLSDGPMNSATLRALAPLPDTAAEVQSVAKILGADNAAVFLQEQANEQNFNRQSLADYRVLYFATHGLLPGELKCQAEPGLVLTAPPQQATNKNQDGLLAASEIAALKLNADLVVLSACNTAGSGGKFGGEALSGLAESFFFAGARSLVVSHWKVPSAETAQLMSGMFATLGPSLQGGVSPALKSAQAALIAEKKTAHPFFWGAFVVVGDGMAVSVTQVADGSGSRP